MRYLLERTLLVLVIGGSLSSVAASADQSDTTLSKVITYNEPAQSINAGKGWRSLSTQPGEPFLLRRLGAAQPSGQRTQRRTSLTYFAQMTDTHITDEMSPARVDFVDPLGTVVKSAWRPGETLNLYTLNQLVKQINANKTSPVQSAGNQHARLGFAVATGDQIDNMQLNEAQWFRAVLDGKRVDPFSGKPITADNPCPSASPDEVAEINDKVAQRRYVGVQNFGDYPNHSVERRLGFWDPQTKNISGPYANFPRYKNLMDRAQQPFTATGLDVPWYVVRGNHDGLIQGNLPADNAAISSFATGCARILPSSTLDPVELAQQADFKVAKLGKLLKEPAFLNKLFSSIVPVAPDPDRRFVSKKEYRALFKQHGYSMVSRTEDAASGHSATYYAWSPDPAVRMIALDTLAEGGPDAGNLDDSQYHWLKRELDRNSALSIASNGKITRDSDPNHLIVIIAGSNPEGTNSSNPDEQSGSCSLSSQPGCDPDPRNSQPIHRGTRGPNSVQSLLLQHPNVVAYITGDYHSNIVTPVERTDGKSGFWSIVTSSVVDFPQQARLLDLVDNHDNTLSLFSTLINTAAPVQAPASGSDALKFSDQQLASIGRQLAANDRQNKNGLTRGTPADHNVELAIRDPRTL